MGFFLSDRELVVADRARERLLHLHVRRQLLAHGVVEELVAGAAEPLRVEHGGIRVAHKGARDPGYDEATVSAAMKKPEISLKVALGLGKGRDRVLTCDLTKEYVAINGDYRS